MGSAIWSILREAASRGPSALADILVTTHTTECHYCVSCLAAVKGHYVIWNNFTLSVKTDYRNFVNKLTFKDVY